MLPSPHPEWNELLEKRDALHAQIAAVIAEIHALEDSESVVLGRYSEAFGDSLLRLQTLEIDVARLKREIELVQAAVNFGREVDYDEIQNILEREFFEWRAKLEKEAARIINQRKVLDHLLDPAKARALRDSFRSLVRRLHPDLHPSQSPAAAELWHRVTAAYENQDIDELSALEILTREDSTLNPSPDSMETLRSTVEKLRLHLDRLLLKLAARRKEWPFDQIPLLDEPAATDARRMEIHERITAAFALIEERRQWLNQLLGH
ncbi:MAG: J domain-containing protein [Luteolibacter sp.]